MNHLDITVTNTTASTATRPVTGGVPIAEGAAPKGSKFAIKDHRGELVPCQATVTAKWPDGSARWVLLDFKSRPPANGALKYKLTWSDEPSGIASGVPVEARGGDKFCVRSANTVIRGAKDALISISYDLAVDLVVTDSKGHRCVTVIESAKVETKGDLRSVLVLHGYFESKTEQRLFGFRVYVHVFAGLSKVLVEPMVLMDSEVGVIQKFREVRLEVRPIGQAEFAALGDETEQLRSGRDFAADTCFRSLRNGKSLKLFQTDDSHYTIKNAKGGGHRAPGWAEVRVRKERIAVAVRDFWQQWPKALEVGPDGIEVGLFPKFEAGTFDHMFDPWYKHDYLFDGNCYRMRTGQVRRWQVWIDLTGDGADLADCANAPLVPSADPAQALSTGVFGDVLPNGAPGMADYDEWADSVFEGYVNAIDQSRDYGAMNWGDWFGERKCNWGNEEYDTTRQIMLEFARSGDPKYLHRGGSNARHNSEVDIIHFVNDDLKRYFVDEVCKSYTNRSIIDNYPIRVGMNQAHCVGHVGGFHSVDQIRKLYLELQGTKYGNPYLCLDPYCISHVFTQGMAWYYFFTGDPWVRETMIRIADNLSQLVLERKFPFTGRACAGRELGWPLLAIAAAYELDYNKRYMRAMKTLAEDALEEQDPNCGGWLQELSGGHCGCQKRHHIGEAGFVSSIRMNALYRYYRLSGDERMPECIKRGVDHMNEDLWNDHAATWRYTSCPATPPLGRPGVTMMTMANVVKLVDDPEHRRILQKAVDAILVDRKKGAGKGYSAAYGGAEAASALAN